ncbi:hypothetical protein BDZ45DRAFT_329574 [Acephala macrosclerotiorum]|nr:hypothetical protein BDZ45DRAFT_329574 [Acephala macrosclerotiorum]
MSYYPTASEFRDIHLLISPLTSIRKVSKRLSSKTPDVSQHWAIRVDDFCYELRKGGLKGSIFRDWKYDNPGFSTPIKIGVTRESWSKLVVIVIKIWFERFEQEYRASTSNCQNFCHCFYKAIRVDANDPDITDEEYDSWRGFPKSLTSVAKSLQNTASVGLLCAAALSRCGCLPIYISAPVVISAEAACAFLLKKTSQDKRYLGLSSIPCEKQGLEAFKDILHATKRAIGRIREPNSKQKNEKRNAKKALQIIEAFEYAYHQKETTDPETSEDDSEPESEDDMYLPRNTDKKRIKDADYDARAAPFDNSGYASGPEDRFSSQFADLVTYNDLGSQYMIEPRSATARGSSFRGPKP